MDRGDHLTRPNATMAPRTALISVASLTAHPWAVFCGFVVVLKLILLCVNSTPKFFMGDSGAYIHTALTGWIPADRSYFYGYAVRWLAVRSEEHPSELQS